MIPKIGNTYYYQDNLKLTNPIPDKLTGIHINEYYTHYDFKYIECQDTDQQYTQNTSSH